METLTFHLEDFDGPLDLLLYLVSKNKMDLHNIPILELIEQYTSIIDGLGAQRMEAASEFIEMAARLVQMKSYLLLPRSEEAARMKEALTGALIEYSTCRKVAVANGRRLIYGCAPPGRDRARQHLPAQARAGATAPGLVFPDGAQRAQEKTGAEAV